MIRSLSFLSSRCVPNISAKFHSISFVQSEESILLARSSLFHRGEHPFASPRIDHIREDATSSITLTTNEKPKLIIPTRPGFLNALKSGLLTGSKNSEAMFKVYCDIADNSDIIAIWKHCGMPDRLTSWIYLLYLHVWLFNMALEGFSNPRSYRDFLIKHMWADIEDRRKLLKTSDFWRKSDLKHLDLVFKNFYLNMDFGYLQSDLELAAAVYKWVLNNHHKGDLEMGDKTEEMIKYTHVETNPEKTLKALEFLVTYIRYHAEMLSKLEPEHLLLLNKTTLGWKPVSYFQR